MDRAETNRVTMFKTVSAYLAQHNSVWSGMAPMVNTVQQLNDGISGVNLAAQKQETPATGLTLDKAATRDALEDVVFLMSEALGVLAHTTNDHSLAALTNLTSSKLGHMDAEELSNRATTVLAAAIAHAQDLAPLQVTRANIDELQQAIQDFNTAKEQPRTATAERVAQTQSLGSRLSELSALLRNQLDPMVNLFRRTNSEFVAGYRAARVIVDRAASHKTSRTAGSTPPANP